MYDTFVSDIRAVNLHCLLWFSSCFHKFYVINGISASAIATLLIYDCGTARQMGSYKKMGGDTAHVSDLTQHGHKRRAISYGQQEKAIIVVSFILLI